jgi:hypothetical protein
MSKYVLIRKESGVLISNHKLSVLNPDSKVPDRVLLKPNMTPCRDSFISLAIFGCNAEDGQKYPEGYRCPVSTRSYNYPMSIQEARYRILPFCRSCPLRPVNLSDSFDGTC